MPVLRWIMNHLIIVFVTVLVVAGLMYQEEIEQELVQLGVMEQPTTLNAMSEPAAPVVGDDKTAADAPAGETPTQMPTHLTPTVADVPAPADTPDQAQLVTPAQQATNNKAAFEAAQAQA